MPQTMPCCALFDDSRSSDAVVGREFDEPTFTYRQKAYALLCWYLAIGHRVHRSSLARELLFTLMRDIHSIRRQPDIDHILLAHIFPWTPSFTSGSLGDDMAS
jgi:hypothetical protein